MTSSGEEPRLRRSVGPVQLGLYALGSMLGSGVYGLMGAAAGVAGNAVWLAFLVAMVAALLTALSYASLGSRYPHAGGAAYIVERAFGRPFLSFGVGLAVAFSSLASVAAQSRVFAANLGELAGLEEAPLSLIAIGFILFLAAVVLRGIRESVAFNIVCTCIEAAGLLIVVGVGLTWWGETAYLELPPPPAGEPGQAAALVLMQAAVLTFFAFIGFEDTINIAEECRDPQRTIPLAVIGAMIAATTLYVAVAITAVSVVPWAELAKSPGPLTRVVETAAPLLPPLVFTSITLFAVTNTALVNYVTASRLVYGMARRGLIPPRLGAVHERRRTPHVSILLLLAIAAPLALIAEVAHLASAAVLLLLGVFTLVNLALVVLQRRPCEPKGRFEIHPAAPLAGAVVCASLAAARIASGDWRAPAIAGGLVATIAVTYLMISQRQAQWRAEAAAREQRPPTGAPHREGQT